MNQVQKILLVKNSYHQIINNQLIKNQFLNNQSIKFYTNYEIGKNQVDKLELNLDKQSKLKMANSKYEYVRQNEEYLNKSLLSECYIVVRIDGSRFHHFSSVHNYVKPNDKRALDLMNEAALFVVKQYFPNIICAYGQSDEFSFILSRKSGLFNRRLNKLNSKLVSAFSSAFTFNWSKYFGNHHLNNLNGQLNDNQLDNQVDNQVDGQIDGQNNNKFNNQTNQFKEIIKLKYPPVFDSRCVLYTSVEEIQDYLKWRQVDCHINNLYNTTFYALTGNYAKWYLDDKSNQYKAEIVKFSNSLTPQQAENRLRGTVSKQKREEILKGMFNIDYELEMEQFRRGSLIVFEKKDDQLFKKWEECLMGKKKKKLGEFNLDDFINFQILNQELIRSDYLDNYLSSVDCFVKRLDNQLLK